ncbi:hypothetical protein UY3_08331 [Chelonia mydas]|uniref:Myb/SANT-like DNA-binding domain-containing protein n=1 Tax=Chelonia mydas TaxID=8469 RepID=M7C261_CHEMY|nr:hypothetical protein UY3_08331 [Chelonia mydas]
MPAPRTRQSPAWSNAELLDPIGIWGEEAVQSQLRSSCRNFDSYGQISRCMIEKGHDWDTLQCRVKVKELWNTYHRAREANPRSGAVPTSCQFYKELDAILSSDPTSTVKSRVDTLLVSLPVESGLSQEEAILEEEGEGEPEAEDDLEARDAGSQELFSTPEEPSQSQQVDIGEAQTGEEAPVAERLRTIRKRPRRSKEDFMREIMMHATTEKKELKEWWDSEKRDRKENVAHQKEATEQLLTVMEHEADKLQAILALQTEQLRAPPSVQPL